MIRVTGLRKHFGDSHILKGIDFEVAPQTVLGIMGASGSGKSTLLRCLNGLETIDGGTIECDNVRLEAGTSHADYRRRVKDLRLKVGTVFQHFYLFHICQCWEISSKRRCTCCTRRETPPRRKPTSCSSQWD